VPLVAITCFEERREEEAAGAKTASRSSHSLPQGPALRSDVSCFQYLPNLETKQLARSKSPFSYVVHRNTSNIVVSDFVTQICSQRHATSTYIILYIILSDVAHGEAFSSWPESLHVLSLVHLTLSQDVDGVDPPQRFKLWQNGCTAHRPQTTDHNTQLTSRLSLLLVQNGRAHGRGGAVSSCIKGIPGENW
jgi:hypothetical protein